MPQPTNAAHFVTKAGKLTVTREQLLKAMAEFDRDDRGKRHVKETHKGWFVQEDGNRYHPKWLLRLATSALLGEFLGTEARKTLDALGFDLRQVEPAEDENGQEDPEEMKFGIESDLPTQPKRTEIEPFSAAR